MGSAVVGFERERLEGRDWLQWADVPGFWKPWGTVWVLPHTQPQKLS